MNTAQSQLEFVKWSWDVVLMLKLHPHQVVSHTAQTLSPSHSDGGVAVEGAGLVASVDLSPPSWVGVVEGSVNLPTLDTSASEELAELRDAVKNEGLLAYYISMSITDLGTE